MPDPGIVAISDPLFFVVLIVGAIITITSWAVDKVKKK